MVPVCCFLQDNQSVGQAITPFQPPRDDQLSESDCHFSTQHHVQTLAKIFGQGSSHLLLVRLV